ncbi:DUF523 and DUF1722 domain-containing protein [Clostridium oceanicum]|uniref:DUF523 and DUF1722 domain-containing protein n=1 Tax=Clostridium oceanicum TaxID=1543 RepID=A0ABN1JN32_9CLOT
MDKLEKPIICVSKCLGFENCRYNGQMSKSSFIEKLEPFVKFVTVCPETSIGLSTPRDTLRLVNREGNTKILQPSTKMDLTASMCEFSKEFLSVYDDIDGFILKSRSPSCGIKDVKVYKGADRGSAFSKGTGIFAEIIKEEYPEFIIEDEGRLTNYKIRENFLTRVYTLYRFKKVKSEYSIKKLEEFHYKNELLLMCCNTKEYIILNNILKKDDIYSNYKVINEYEKHLKKCIKISAKYTSRIKILKYALNFFKKDINKEEEIYILDSIDKYKNGNLPFSTPLYLIKSYAVRFNIEYLINQTFFKPYPDNIMEVRDSGKSI